MYEILKKYSREVTSFHMPGHKGGKISPLDELLQVDVTEVDGLDDLHHPTGIIEEVNRNISRLYGSGYSTMLVNGSTGGLLSAITACIKREGYVLIARNSHKAVYNGVVLNRLFANTITPSYLLEDVFFAALDPNKIRERFERSRNKIEALIMTSPTYEGIVSDIAEIAAIVHSYGAILIVDEAHGAHFCFSDRLPKSALELGADIVIQSAHKTLPCMTQTAFLHISEEALSTKRIDLLSLQKQLAVFQTSSPSYVLMSSIEKGVDYMDQHRDEFDRQIRELTHYLESYRCDFGEWLFTKVKDNNLFDATRLTFIIHDHPMTGWELNHILRSDFAIQVEMAGMKHIVAISTIADSIVDISRLGDAIKSILNRGTSKEKVDNHFSYVHKIYDLDSDHFNQIAVSYDSKGVLKKLNNALGYRSNAFIIPYPPGIPLVIPGEVFTKEIIDYIHYLLENEMEVYGIIKGEVAVIE